MTQPISRRTLLRGAGVAVSLPWMQSLPVWGGQADASPLPKRFAALFMACGVNAKHWWAKGSGAHMELGSSLAPLEPIKDKVNVISGLFNKNATGVGIHPGQTGNILSGASLTAGGLGGTLATGRVLDYSKLGDDNRKLCSFYISLMNRMGLSVEQFGDASEELQDL